MTPDEIHKALHTARDDLDEARTRLRAVSDTLANIRRAVEQQEITQQPPSQEPRLTLGRVPAGGPGLYVVYFNEWHPMVYRWRDEGWHHATHHPHMKSENGQSFANSIQATFGPVASVLEVSEALAAARGEA